MRNLNKSSENSGYIFISHSHYDISKVRKIRNVLEEHGFDPLCFYLKCLDDRNELEDLIKREIDAREWFLFVNSENSRSSEWVTKERTYINKTNKKKIVSVDIDDPNAVNQALLHMCRNLRVFLSYSNEDYTLAQRIRTCLTAHDYACFNPDMLQSGDIFSDRISSEILLAASKGCVMAIISNHFIHSNHVLEELRNANDSDGNILPVLVGDVKVYGEYEFLVANKQQYHLPQNPTDEEISSLIDTIGCHIVDSYECSKDS